MLNSFKYSLPTELDNAVKTQVESWRNEDKISRIWAKDASVWSGDDEAKWLGWLDIVAEERGNVEKYLDLHRDIEAAGFTDVLLMGMGGSSLCPEVLAMTFGKANFHILDSTVPAQVVAVESRVSAWSSSRTRRGISPARPRRHSPSRHQVQRRTGTCRC